MGEPVVDAPVLINPPVNTQLVEKAYRVATDMDAIQSFVLPVIRTKSSDCECGRCTSVKSPNMTEILT